MKFHCICVHIIFRTERKTRKFRATLLCLTKGTVAPLLFETTAPLRTDAAHTAG